MLEKHWYFFLYNPNNIPVLESCMSTFPIIFQVGTSFIFLWKLLQMTSAEYFCSELSALNQSVVAK